MPLTPTAEIITTAEARGHGCAALNATHLHTTHTRI